MFQDTTYDDDNDQDHDHNVYIHLNEEDESVHRTWWDPSTWHLHRPSSLSLLRQWTSKKDVMDTTISPRPVSFHSTMTLSVWDEVLLHANESERLFFDMLTQELDKVSLFYNEKEKESRVKFESVKMQIKLIADYGRYLLEIGPSMTPYPSLFQSRQYRLSNVPSFVGHATDPHISYSVARNRLKKALTEFYRSLEFLKSFQILNKTGFEKILKKFDKTAGWKASGMYGQQMKKYHWVTSTCLDDMTDETEKLYINEFADGHRRRGMRKLRVPEKQDDYNATTWRIGLFLGIAFSLLFQAVHLGFDPKTLHQLPNVYTNLQIYASFILPILFCLGFSLNLLIWHRSRINYKFIFELNPRQNLDYHQFAELPAFMLLLSSAIMYIDFSQWYGSSLPSELCPMVLFVSLLSIMFCPFDVLYFSARKWLGVALGRILLSYCFPVEFRDFFIADELNSLSYSFWTCSYFFCAYGCHWVGLTTHCNLSTSWLTPLLASLPPWWRLLQCFRRYKDSNEKVHLINGAKYTSSILATLMNGMRKIHGTQLTLCLWIVISLINSCYTSTWDIKMDWGLMQKQSQYRFLRNELVFHRWAYYLAIPINIILRFSWTLSLAPLGIHGDILGFVVALLEGMRRIQWNIFRLENEHLNNCGQYRAIKEIPLPFALTDEHHDQGKLDQHTYESQQHDDHNVVTMDQEQQQEQQQQQKQQVNNRQRQQQQPFYDSTTSITQDRPPSSPIPTSTSYLHRPLSNSLRHSYHDAAGSFYGKRDFENKHDGEDTADFLQTQHHRHSQHLSAQSSPLDHVLTHIRSLGASADFDVSDTEHEDDDLDSDDDDDDQ
ncbi:unnamed protein product [Absidia cylindrospora]